jgi:hypothetical protein
LIDFVEVELVLLVYAKQAEGVWLEDHTAAVASGERSPAGRLRLENAEG